MYPRGVPLCQKVSRGARSTCHVTARTSFADCRCSTKYGSRIGVSIVFILRYGGRMLGDITEEG